MSGYGDSFRLTLITNDLGLAASADRAGVNQVGVDLEYLGKAERQPGLDSRMSRHTVEDLAAVGRQLQKASAFVRVNPLNDRSADELERVLHSGARVVMLPFFTTPEEVEGFVQLVDGRARVVILVETGAALIRLREILAVSGVDEAMVGLNDLRLQLGVNSHFEVLASPLLEYVAAEISNAGVDFSVGGVGRPDDRTLPVSPDLVLAQYPRLGATGAWISRSFLNGMPVDLELGAAVRAVRLRLSEWAGADAAALEQARDELLQQARAIAHR